MLRLDQSVAGLLMALVAGCGADDRGRRSEAHPGDAGPSSDAAADASPEAVPVAPPLTPGSCAGDGIACAVPASLPLVPGPAVECSALDGGSLQIEWQSLLGSVRCPVGDCVAAGKDLFVARDGSVWVVADLHLPRPSEDRQPLGTALLHFDPSGARLSAVVTRFVSELQNGLPLVTSGGLGSWDGEHVAVVVPAKGPASPGFDLAEFDARGDLTSRRRFVRRADSIASAFVSDGVLLGYGYSVPATDGGSLTFASDIAFVQADGALGWQQTALANALLRGTLGDDALVWHGQYSPEPHFSLARLDARGNVVWSRPSPSWAAPAIAESDGGRFFCVTSTQSTEPGGGSGNVLDLLDGDGNSAWELLLDAGFSYPILREADGRALVFTGSIGFLPQLLAVSADGRACTAWRFDSLDCAESEAPFGCPLVQVRVANGAYYVVTDAGVGKVLPGELP